MLKIDGGRLICSRQTARKRGSIQEKKKPDKNAMFCLEKMKQEDEKRKMEELHQQKSESNDQECGRQCWAFA